MKGSGQEALPCVCSSVRVCARIHGCTYLCVHILVHVFACDCVHMCS